MLIPNGDRPRDLFSPLPDRRRRALPERHQEMALGLRHQAGLWWSTTDQFMELCLLRI